MFPHLNLGLGAIPLLLMGVIGLGASLRSVERRTHALLLNLIAFTGISWLFSDHLAPSPPPISRIIIRPAGVVVSIASVKLRNPAPASASCCMLTFSDATI